MAEAGDAIGGGAQAIISSQHARVWQTAGLLDAEGAGRSPRNALRRRSAARSAQATCHLLGGPTATKARHTRRSGAVTTRRQPSIRPEGAARLAALHALVALRAARTRHAKEPAAGTEAPGPRRCCTECPRQKSKLRARLGSDAFFHGASRCRLIQPSFAEARLRPASACGVNVSPRTEPEQLRVAPLGNLTTTPHFIVVSY